MGLKFYDPILKFQQQSPFSGFSTVAHNNTRSKTGSHNSQPIELDRSLSHTAHL